MPVQLVDVHFRYQNGPHVLKGVTLSIGRGESVALVGPSGSGKSTLLEIIGGLLKPDSGTVSGQPSREAMRWIFQTPTTLERRTALHNVQIGAMAVMSRRAAEDEARRALGRIGLGDFADQPVHDLSGGEQQRVQVARALVGAPALVLADEPSGQLDRTSTELVTEAMRTLLQKGTTFVIATHDRQVVDWCDRVLALQDGRLSSS